MPVAYSYIRFSTPQQSLGQSAERQLEKSRAWAKAKGIRLVETFRDDGISSYRAKNYHIGALQNLMQACRQKRIKKGDYLLVEAIDRISRADYLTAHSIMIELIKTYGLRIITIDDGVEFSAETFSKEHFLPQVLTAKLQTANLESKRKSDLLHDKWASRRVKAKDGIKTNFRKPSWLEWDSANNTYLLNKVAARSIQAIFRVYNEGYGAVEIVRALNGAGKVIVQKLFGAAPIPPLPGCSKWTLAMIQKLLTARELIGELQFYKQKEEYVEQDGIVHLKRKSHAEGDPIANYFPRVISDAAFYRVQEQLRKRNVKGPKKPDSAPPLFTGLLYCAECTGPIWQQASYTRLKNGKRNVHVYLRCSHARLYSGTAHSLASCRLDLFESTFFKYVAEYLKLSTLFPVAEQDDLIGELIAEAVSIEEDIARLKKMQGQWLKDAVADKHHIKNLLYSQVKEADDTIARNEKRRAEIESEKDRLESVNRGKRIEDLRNLILKGSLHDDRVRRHARLCIRESIHRIYLEPKSCTFLVQFEGSSRWKIVYGNSKDEKGIDAILKLFKQLFPADQVQEVVIERDDPDLKPMDALMVDDIIITWKTPDPNSRITPPLKGGIKR